MGVYITLYIYVIQKVGKMYNLVYEKRFGTANINPWSQEELLKNNIRLFNSANQSMWIKAGPNAYCFLKDFDKIENYINNNSASDSVDYLNKYFDRKENIQEVINKWLS